MNNILSIIVDATLERGTLAKKYAASSTKNAYRGKKYVCSKLY